MESSFGNSSDEVCNKATCQCSSNDTDKHHTSSDTSNLVSACSVSVNSSPLEGSVEGEEGFDCSNKSKKFISKESQKETGPLSDKSEPSSITSLRDVYVGTSSPKGGISECSVDQVESNYRRSIKHDIFDICESENFKSGEGLEREGLARKSVKSGDQNQDFVKMDTANVNQPPVRSHPADSRDGSDLLVDVKVCDICGDAGREDLLAICSKCTDGAEHIYCMWKKLDKVPRGNWLCEECMSSQENENHMQVKYERAIQGLNRSNQIHRHAGTSSTATIKTRLDSHIEAPNATKSRRDKFSAVPQFPAKRKAGDFDSALVKKRRVETTVVDSAPSHQPMSRGTLSQSKSFNISDSKREVQSCEESEKKNGCGEASIIDKKKDGSDRKISRSLSFNNVSSGRQNIDQRKVKMISASTSRVEDLKINKSPKASSSVQNKLICKSDNPRVSSPPSGSCTSPSKNVKSISCNARPTEVHSSVSKNLNPKHSQLFINSSDLSKPSRHVGREDSKYREDRAVTGGVKRLRSCLSDAARNPSPIIADSSREQRSKSTLRSSSFPTQSRHRDNTGQIVKNFQSPVSSNQDDKVHEGSNFGTTNEQIKGGTLRSHKSKSIANAAESCRVISPRASVQGRGKGEDVDQSNPKDLGPNIFLKTDSVRKFAVPSPDFIWKGGFEMVRCEKLPSLINGIQAHVCNQASLKAFEVGKKFPCNIPLEEVSRSSTWPTQFRQTNPSENNVALYFFAVDLESYEREYKSMVECLMYHDIALKGTIDELELLIFPSNLLPRTSQRWNNLFYLWGIFRGKKIIKTNCRTSSPNDQSIPAMNNAILDRDNSLPGRSEFENMHSSGPERECFKRVENSQCQTSSGNEAVIPDLNSPISDHDYAIPGGSGVQNIPSSGPSSESVSASKLFHNIQHSSNFISPMDWPSASCERNDDNLNSELRCPEQKNFDFQTNFDSKDRDDSNNFPKDQVLADRKQEDLERQDVTFAVETGPAEKNPNNKGSVKLFGNYIG